ncbi:hypothetical protein [Brevibacillus fulvus]|uniref:Lipoprotein signal peptidase n=1 Tax=Brevibacillus fulvus TaxID=1125967 RepID=A0A938XXX9_9BACL|nr:hypothetical protein [Brevibacillus fulvus]MBM7589730.1 lipoprotein signal peptidase [Brevibacillus fulvus]
MPDIQFDSNEWMVLIISVLLLLLFAKLPRKMPPALIVLVMLLGSFLGLTIDRILGTDYPFDLYDTFDTPKFDWIDAVIYLIPYPLYCYFFSALYDYWRPQGWARFGLAFILACLTVFLEWIATLFGVFTYNHWKLLWSFYFYLPLIYLYTLFVDYIRKLYEKNKRGRPEKDRPFD